MRQPGMAYVPYNDGQGFDFPDLDEHDERL